MFGLLCLVLSLVCSTQRCLVLSLLCSVNCAWCCLLSVLFNCAWCLLLALVTFPPAFVLCSTQRVPVTEPEDGDQSFGDQV